MPKPSVLHVYKDYFPPVLGGVEKAINWMCAGTRGEFHVRVLVASRSRRFVDEVIDGVRVVRVGCLGRALSAPLAPGFLTWLRRLDSDILHFHMPNPSGELACLAYRKRRGRVVATYHSDVVRQKITGMLYGPLQQKFLRGARVIMPTSEQYLKSSKTLQPHRERCRVVPLGVPLEDLKENEASRAYSARIREMAAGRVSIVFIGLLRYYKGLHFLIEAMKGLPENSCLFIAGAVAEGKEEEKRSLERLVGELGLEKRVKFLGEISDAEAVGLRRAGDIFCLPSHLRSEAFGLTQIEAMACSLPVVCTDLPGVSEVNADGVTGLVVEPGSAETLRGALGSLIGDQSRRSAMGEAARKRAESLFSTEVMSKSLKKVYDEVLRSKV